MAAANCRNTVRYPQLLVVVVLASCGGTHPTVAREHIASETEKQLAVDTRAFELTREKSRPGSVGILASGGYCQVGAKEDKYSYRVIAERPRDAIVEVVHHPAEYDFVVHDLVGALRLTASGARFPGPPPHDDTIQGIELVDWNCGGSSGTHAIALATHPSTPKAAVVAWHSETAGSNGLVTVVMRYAELEGLPKQLLDEFLARYPSAIDKKTFLPADWVDDDLKKWAQILREEPDNKVTLDIAARNLWQYEQDAWHRAKATGAVWEPWNSMDIAKSLTEAEEFKERSRLLIDKIEHWCLDRKR